MITLQLTILPPNSTQATHKVCRRNEAKSSRAKWEIMFCVLVEPKDTETKEIAAELIQRQRVVSRDLLRDRVKILPV